MVRLVFRPYAYIWRTICTSVSLQASIRVSSDFTLHRHSSPSFGYQQWCFHSNQSLKVMIGWCWRINLSFLSQKRERKERLMTWHLENFTFISPSGFPPFWLASALDSLVRVSRRVWWVHRHFGSRQTDKDCLKKNSGQIDQRRTCFWWSSTEILTWLFQRQSGKKKTQESYFLCRCVQFFASISVTVSLMFSSQFKWMRNSPELVWKTTSFSCQKKEKHQFNQRPQWR